MKKIPFSSLVITGMMAASLQSQAQISMMSTTFRDAPPQPIDAGSPPSPIDPSVPFRYSDLRPIYDSGVATNEAALTGEWKMLAIATTAVCADLEADAYDPKGIKNGDGTVRVLTFQNIIKPSPPGSGQTTTPVFTVTLNNWGQDSSDQGPYVVNPNEPQFSQWAYSSNGGAVNVAYLSYNCRLSAKEQNILICGLKLNITDRSGLSQTSLDCADSNQLGEFVLFSK